MLIHANWLQAIREIAVRMLSTTWSRLVSRCLGALPNRAQRFSVTGPSAPSNSMPATQQEFVDKCFLMAIGEQRRASLVGGFRFELVADCSL